MVEIKPQPGPQTDFFRSRADIVIYGGAAGGGKTWSLLIEPLRHIHIPAFGGVILRRTTPEIMNEGGPWDESSNIYPQIGGTPRVGDRTWLFPSGASVQFSHLEHETDKLKWQGSQIALLEFDELTHFTETQFFYMLSRNRSTCGIRPYIRASTNPSAESWVRKFISPFIGEDGFPNDKCGDLIYFARSGGVIFYDWSMEELKKKFPHLESVDIMSLTFIPSRLEDNKKLIDRDPGYKGRLLSLPTVEQERLLRGNWNVKSEEGRMFFDPIYGNPPENLKITSYLDPAFTMNVNSDYSALCIGGERDGNFYIVGGYLFKCNLDQLYPAVIAALRAHGCDSLTVEQNQAQIALLSRFRELGQYVSGVSNTKNKTVRIQNAVGTNWEKIIFGPMVTKEFINQIENYSIIPPSAHDDAPDSLAGLIDCIRTRRPIKAVQFGA